MCAEHSQQLKYRHDVSPSHAHCEHLADVYRDLTELAQSDMSVIGDNVALLSNISQLIQSSVHAAVDKAIEQHVDAVYDVLMDFKEELQRTQQSMNDRLSAQDDVIHELRESLRQCKEEQRDIALAMSKMASEYESHNDRRRRSTSDEDAEAAMDDFITRRSLQKELAQHSEQMGHVMTHDVMHEQLARHAETCEKLIDAKLEAVTREVQRLQSDVDTDAQLKQHCEGELAELDARTRRKAKALSRRIDTLSAALDVVQHVQEDSRHTHEVQATTSALQHDLVVEQIANIQQQLERHTVVQSELRSHCSLAGSFAELRDWLTDLEQRVASRAETSETASRLDARIALVETELRLKQIDSRHP